MHPLSDIVHIIPVEVGPTFRAKSNEKNPDFVYLITQHQDEEKELYDAARNNVEELHDFYSFANTTVFGVEDYFDLFEIMGVYRFICEQHKDGIILINVGSGSKLTAIAGFIVSNWYENATCFYPKRRISKSDTNEMIPYNEVEEIKYIQPFPIKQLDTELVPVLNYIKNDPKTKKQILERLLQLNMIADEFLDDNGKMKERSPQSLYNILKRNYLIPLEEDDLLEETADGQMKITKRGSEFQIIFGKSVEDFHYENI